MSTNKSATQKTTKLIQNEFLTKFMSQTTTTPKQTTTTTAPVNIVKQSTSSVANSASPPKSLFLNNRQREHSVKLFSPPKVVQDDNSPSNNANQKEDLSSFMGVKTEALLHRAKEIAIQKAIGFFYHPGKLSEIDDLISFHVQQNQMLNTQIQHIMTQQVEESKKANQLLRQSTQQHTTCLQNSFSTIHDTAYSNYNVIHDYSLMRQVYISLERLSLVKQSLSKLLDLQDELDAIEDMICNDEESLLEAHERLIELEQIQDDALLEISTPHNTTSSSSNELSTEEIYNIFKIYFERIKQVSMSFENLIFELLDDCLNKCMDEPATIVRVMQVIEREEERDLQKSILLLEKVETFEKSKFKLSCKGYKQRALAVMENVIKEKFQFEMKEVASRPIGAQLEVVTQVIQEIMSTVWDYMVPCFPPNYLIATFFESKLQQIMLQWFQTSLSQHIQNLTNHDKLQVYHWCKQYAVDMEQYIRDPIDFSSQLEIIESEYIRSLTRFLLECTQNIIKVEFSGKVTFHKSETGKPFTPSAVEMFTMINSQFDELYNEQMTNWMEHMGPCCNAILQFYCNEIVKNVESQVHELDLIRLIALTNNSHQCRIYLDELMDRMSEMMEHTKMKSLQLDVNLQNFDWLGQQMCAMLVDICMQDMEVKFNELFTKEWYSIDNNSMQMVSDTFEDYFANDFNKCLEEQLVTLLMEMACIKTVKRYLDSLFIFRQNSLQEGVGVAMDHDLKNLKKFFSEGLPEQFVDNAFAPIQYISRFLSVKEVEDMIFVVNEILKDYPDCPYIVLEYLVNAQTGWSKNFKANIMEQLKVMYSTNTKLGKKKEQSIFAQYEVYVNPKTAKAAKTSIIANSGPNATEKKEEAQKKKEKKSTFSLLRKLRLRGKKKKKETKVEEDLPVEEPKVSTPTKAPKKTQDNVEIVEMSDLLGEDLDLDL